MDYLSFLTLRQERHPDRPAFDGQDCIVLNSVSNLSKALRPLGDYERISKESTVCVSATRHMCTAGTRT